MDPALFRIDWEVLFEALTTLVVLSFLIERALAVIFEHRAFVERAEKKGLKEIIAVVVSYTVVQGVEFDIFAIVFHLDHPSKWGFFMTAAIVAGGSKASIKLFHDILDIKGKALREKQAALAPSVDSSTQTP